ncbi:MAG: hypothetical protein H7Y20_01685 [Bryobacteraceae bacterium]|nr:hypothetical protein [Bryobacteraceae bacterium]
MGEYAKVSNIDVVGQFETVNGTTTVLVVREHFEADVGKILDSLWVSETGGPVLRALGSTPGMVRILPRPSAPGQHVNSEARVDVLVGNISFEPAAFSSKLNQLSASETLLHELVHVVRRFTGHMRTETTNDAYENIEEYYAIVVENVYRSEFRMVGLRGGHGSESLPPKQRDSAAVFLSAGQNRKRLERLRRENPDLFNGIASGSKANWNPFRLVAPPVKKP